MKIFCAKIGAFLGICKRVEAAGGLVVNERGEWLLIHRNGRWDLPKGHIEAGEEPAGAAVREVGEETGVEDAAVVRLLCTTYHTYIMHGRRELKHTYWYEMRTATGSSSAADLHPQHEEGIDRAAWLTPDEVQALLPTMFPGVRKVIKSLG